MKDRLNSPEDRWEWISETLVAALQIADFDARNAFLRERCGDDGSALRELQSLLAADTNVTSLIDGDAIASAARAAMTGTTSAKLTKSDADIVEHWIGQRLGAYEIVALIAVGGMGAVFKAKRADASYETLVAIKIMRADLTAKAAQNVLARFRAERQMLASLNHPNITRLLDGGSTEDGLPYFVMEYVDGEPIDSYCETRGLPIAERLAKFRDVCSAVQFAHQRLIVHRDLKPSNILVDRQGVVKLLDFGIARLLDTDAEAQQQETNLATTMLALTPAYASPEQVKSEAITTASDIYSLGVVLYRLLTGVSPYKSKTTQPMALAREIAETDPDKPSTAIVTGAREADDSAQANNAPKLDVARLKKTLRGDLDNIVLMALRKDPARRYASAEQFSEDIRRNLAHEPVIAHADSLAYRANKFVRRNRWSVAFASLATLGLVGGIVSSTYQAGVAREALQVAEREKVRGDRHFSSVQRIVNEILFASYDQLERIEGTTKIRENLLTGATQYLSALGDEPPKSRNRDLLFETGSGLLRLANLQGQLASGGSTAKPALAKASYTKAIEALQKALELSPSDEQVIAGVIRAQRLFAVFLSNSGDIEESRRWFDTSVTTGSKYLGQSSALLKLRLEAAVALVSHVFYVRGDQKGDYERYREYGAKARSALEKMLSGGTSKSERDEIEDYLLYAYGTLAQQANTRNDGTVDYQTALEWANAALELAQRRVVGRENDPRALTSLTTAYADISAIAKDAGDFPTSIRNESLGLAILERRAALDSENTGLSVQIIGSLARLVEGQFETNDFAAVEASLTKAKRVVSAMEPAAREEFDAVSARMSLDAAQAKMLARRAIAEQIPRSERVRLCAASIAAYRSAEQGIPRWEAFYKRSIKDEFVAIRKAIEVCSAYVDNFPS